MPIPSIKITECPRDAMQGLPDFIPTDLKAAYINRLLKVGFDTIDFGSFVSPKAIPQMRDTAEVLTRLDLSTSTSKLLAIVANYRGAEEAAQHREITYLGFPFSISETFQRRNTNMTIDEAFEIVQRSQALCLAKGKQLLVYLSMGFGNPYGDDWDIDIVAQWADRLAGEGVKTIALADTVGSATADQINHLYPLLVDSLPAVEFGIHLHTKPDDWRDKIAAAYTSGCRRFDTAIKGYGGCPMAKDELTGNVATENVLSYLISNNVDPKLDMDAFNEAITFSTQVFNQH